MEHTGAPSSAKLEHCVALADYAALDDDELSFNKGATLVVLQKTSRHAGFWRGYAVPTDDSPAASVKEGWFPSCFVSSNMNVVGSARPLSSSSSSHNSRCCATDKALCLVDAPVLVCGREEGWLPRGSIVEMVRPGEVAGWWHVRQVRIPTTASPSTRRRTLLQRVPLSEAEVQVAVELLSSDIVLAVFPFAGEAGEGELSFDEGTMIEVHHRWNDGWWEGSVLVPRGPELETSGEQVMSLRGLFPSNFTVPNLPTTQPPFFCSTCKQVLFDASMSTAEATTEVAAPPCARCQRHDRIASEMLSTLELHLAQGKSGEGVDLFESIALFPSPTSNAADGGMLTTPHQQARDDCTTPTGSFGPGRGAAAPRSATHASLMGTYSARQDVHQTDLCESW